MIKKLLALVAVAALIMTIQPVVSSADGCCPGAEKKESKKEECAKEACTEKKDQCDVDADKRAGCGG